ncbi:arginine--tRNA ligase [Boudabousia liubingyangii]|uniref:Arginine--tRNA ligase n=1 Tax=Boudabousia liubingyangii TaxID=1921764 RepID=A0A1Q5PKV3_9ACTO|nr:arginine--tRNA ligase [Boudabousia liubingyangii]OKL47260.1 arginine--tRNA ligase [Boudabousia liubingyangii]
MTPFELSEVIFHILEELTELDEVNLSIEDLPQPVKVERPRVREHGDWATNVALQLGKKAGLNPRAFADLITEKLAQQEGIDSTEVAGPGFINIRLSAASAGELARTILAAGSEYGTSKTMAGEKINLEYVSANPTGPVHLGHARWAAVGDSLARILTSQGAEVTREYYFNDHGAQIDRFAKSLLARARGLEVPEDGYGGQYIDDIAQEVISIETAAGRPNPSELEDEKALEVFRSVGVQLMFDEIKSELHDFKVEFDVYFHEDTLHKSGDVDRAIERLRERGMVYDKDGAIWLKSSELGDDKDRVIIKSDGQAAYFSGDIAYYLNKRERGADAAIYLLGADHHGYIGRMYAMCAAFGDEPGKNLQIIIGQLVNLQKNGKPLRMSKRAGTIVTLEDLVDAVGVDAARYALARSSMDSMIDIDLDLLASASNENPVYYVQYAHARTCSVARNAAEAGITLESEFDPAQLDSAADTELLGTLAQFPEIVAQAATLREQHRVARYLESLAAAYHAWYGNSRVTPRAGESVEPVHAARLYLNQAVAQVLSNGLNLLGVSAPERM